MVSAYQVTGLNIQCLAARASRAKVTCALKLRLSARCPKARSWFESCCTAALRARGVFRGPSQRIPERDQYPIRSRVNVTGSKQTLPTALQAPAAAKHLRRQETVKSNACSWPAPSDRPLRVSRVALGALLAHGELLHPATVQQKGAGTFSLCCLLG